MQNEAPTPPRRRSVAELAAALRAPADAFFMGPEMLALEELIRLAASAELREAENRTLNLTIVQYVELLKQARGS